MAGTARRHGLLSRTLRRLGPPPLPPRRYCVKFRAYDARQRAGTGSHGVQSAGQRAFM
jgi:hypothetical protein